MNYYYRAFSSNTLVYYLIVDGAVHRGQTSWANNGWPPSPGPPTREDKQSSLPRYVVSFCCVPILKF